MSDNHNRVRIAALSDLHCTKTSQGAFQPLLAQAVRGADVLLLCGDLTDHGLPEEAEVLAKELAGVLRIDTNRATAKYAVAEFPTPWPGRAFHLAKVTDGTDPAGESYAVFCSHHGPAGDSCDCKGFTYKGTCKHRDACRALLANGWL